ncbi:uncharacterized protein LOC123713063 [Pieris brassicae]|uniref:uncharacterized protein LOC123713063 n=1 Tax=Pieris brassicae TaxID=7116 RepID=UPI001E661A55|nr:uncharacterized protein LOC123713063 [Pieris brassicae]
MCNLLTLPEEILILIIKQLDLASVNNLYNTCRRTRDVICLFKVMKKCYMSCNRMASAHILQLPFFKDISPFIVNLNLACVSNLNKTLLLSAIRRLKCLTTINVSYTNISIIDFLQIYKNCSTIIDVTLDSIFDKKNVKTLQDVPRNILLMCQDVFEKFKSIHFIGSLLNLVYNTYTLFMLQKTKNIKLKFSISPLHNVLYTRFACDLVPISFDEIVISSVNTEHDIESLNNPHFPHHIDKYEYFLLTMSKSCETQIYCTSLFRDFIKNNYNKDPGSLTSLCEHYPSYKAVFLFWNKETNVFNEGFFSCLQRHLQPYFVYCIDITKNQLVPHNYDRFYIKYEDPLMENPANSHDRIEPSCKKIRLGQPNIVIDYDDIFKEKERIMLSIYFNYSSKQNPIALSPSSNFLTKLTYLSLTGSIPYSSEFFNVLFRCCLQLETLNYEDNFSVNYIKSIARSIPLSKSIKNVRLLGKRIDHRTLIMFLSQCSSLENVHIVELSKENFENNDYRLMFQKCKNLYCLYLYARISENNRNKQLMTLNRAKVKSQQHHISVKVINVDLHGALHSNPFSYLFKI